MPKFQPKKWNKDKYTRKSHNCYAYFLNKKSRKIRNKCRGRLQSKNFKNKLIKTGSNYKNIRCRKCYRPKPGRAAGLRFTKKNYNCKNVVRRVLLDNKSIKKISKNKKCPKNYYKGVSLINTKFMPGIKWFHFARQDSNGKWSHKDGISKAELYNINKRVYNHPDKKVCSHFCVPKNSKQLRMKEEREFIDCKTKNKKRKTQKKYSNKRK